MQEEEYGVRQRSREFRDGGAESGSDWGASWVFLERLWLSSVSEMGCEMRGFEWIYVK